MFVERCSAFSRAKNKGKKTALARTWSFERGLDCPGIDFIGSSDLLLGSRRAPASLADSVAGEKEGRSLAGSVWRASDLPFFTKKKCVVCSSRLTLLACGEVLRGSGAATDRTLLTAISDSDGPGQRRTLTKVQERWRSRTLCVICSARCICEWWHPWSVFGIQFLRKQWCYNTPRTFVVDNIVVLGSFWERFKKKKLRK